MSLNTYVYNCGLFWADNVSSYVKLETNNQRHLV